MFSFSTWQVYYYSHIKTIIIELHPVWFIRNDAFRVLVLFLIFSRFLTSAVHYLCLIFSGNFNSLFLIFFKWKGNQRGLLNKAWSKFKNSGWKDAGKTSLDYKSITTGAKEKCPQQVWIINQNMFLNVVSLTSVS